MTPILRAEQMCPLFELRFYDKQKKRKLNKFDWKKVIFEKRFFQECVAFLVAYMKIMKQNKSIF